VRITHLPTNTVVSCQDEKSQIKNREKGMRVLRARLYEMEQQKQQARWPRSASHGGSGDRSEKIRTYNFPQNRVTDHRIGFTAHQLPEFMDGRIQPMIDALITHFQSEKLKGTRLARLKHFIYHRDIEEAGRFSSAMVNCRSRAKIKSTSS